MIAIVTLLTAFPLGWFLTNRLAAHTAYAIVYLWAFVFQSTYLMLDSLGGAQNPAFDTAGFPLAYGVMALVVFAVGFGLVHLGQRVGAGRARRIRRQGDAANPGPRL